MYIAEASQQRPQNTGSNQPPSAAQASSYVNIHHHGVHLQSPAVLQPVLKPVLEAPTYKLFNNEFVGSDVDPGPLPALEPHQHHQADNHQYFEDDQHQGLYRKGFKEALLHHFDGGAGTGAHVFGE